MKIAIVRSLAAALALVLSAGGALAQGALTREQVARRYNVRVFGTVLVGAAHHGAELLGLRVRQIDPSIILLSGTSPRAQGFVIEGHGVFFHVEIPGINPWAIVAMQTRGRGQAAEAMILKIRQLLPTVTDAQQRVQLEQEVRRLEQWMLPPGPVQNRPAAMTMSGTAPAREEAPPPAMPNPEMEYERLVTEQLVNAMLDHSHQLGLGADEWLTIAARGSQGPLMPEAVFDDSVTITLRIKGSDLAAFRAGSLTRDEARARVSISEF